MATICERNAERAAVVRSWLEEALSFGALEMAVADLDAIREVCDAGEIEFSDFAALDEAILSFGEVEQDARAKRARVDPEGGLDSALDGEQGSLVEVDGLDGVAAAAICRAAGAYCLLFERPLLALGAFRHARALDPSCAVAANGMASCLQSLGRRVAAARLALSYWSSGEATGAPLDVGSGAGAAAGGLLFVLAQGAAELAPPASPTPLVRAIVPYLGTGAAGAVRSVLRRWLVEWVGEHGLAEALGGVAAARTLCADDLAARRAAAPLWQRVLLDSSVCCCASLEPLLREARCTLLNRLQDGLNGAGESGADGTRGLAAAAEAAACVACHVLHAGHCLPESAHETATVEALCNELKQLSDADSAAVASAFWSGDASAAVVRLLSRLMAVAMYRPLRPYTAHLTTLLASRPEAVRCTPPSEFAKGVSAPPSWVDGGAGLPNAMDALDEHLLLPARRDECAAALPRDAVAMPHSHTSSTVQAFYTETLYPAWRYPETFGFAPCAIGERMRRQQPAFEWMHDALTRHRVLVAGAGSGHQVAQLLLTHTHCDVVAVDLSATSLAYARSRIAHTLPREAHRVTYLVGDLTKLAVQPTPPAHPTTAMQPTPSAQHATADPAPTEPASSSAPAGGDAASEGSTAPSPAAGASAAPLRAAAAPLSAAPLGSRFHLVCCVGVLHHLAAPAAALATLARTLQPGGLLQLATYSTLSVDTWRPAARARLHALLPHVVDGKGALRRQPTDAELRWVRARLLGDGARGDGPAPRGDRPAQGEAAAGAGEAGERAGAGEGSQSTQACNQGEALGEAHEQAAAAEESEIDEVLRMFDEFYCAGGIRDLLFHPQETTFTLLQLRDMLVAAHLRPLGVFFASLETDARARRAYRDAGGTDAAQADLALWHEVERREVETFGRMHCVHAVYEP